MRRLPRILLNAATAVSLVLCQVGVVFWCGGMMGGQYVLLSTLVAAAVDGLYLRRYWIAVPAADAGSVHCAHCGYDLRATPDRCPECGTPRETP